MRHGDNRLPAPGRAASVSHNIEHAAGAGGAVDGAGPLPVSAPLWGREGVARLAGMVTFYREGVLIGWSLIGEPLGFYWME